MMNPGYFNQIFKLFPSPGVILLAGPACFKIVEANDAFLKVTATNKPEVSGQCFLELLEKKLQVHDEYLGALRQSLVTVIKTGSPHSMDWLQHNLSFNNPATLDRKYYQGESAPLPGENGVVEYILHTLSDVTDKCLLQKNNERTATSVRTKFKDRRYNRAGTTVLPIPAISVNGKIDRSESKHTRDEIEEALLASEKKSKYLFDNNPSPMVIWDFETLRIIDCNEEALLKYGYSREEFLQLTIRDIRPDEDVPLINTITKDEETYQRIHKKVWRHKKKNGEIIFVDVSGHLIDYHGRRVSMVQLNDVTESIKSQNELKASEERYKLLFHSSPIAKWVYDLDTLEILDVNDTAIKHYGYNRQEFLSMTVNDIKPKEDQPKMAKLLESIKNGEGLVHFGIFTQLKKDRTKIQADVSGTKFTFKDRNCMMVESVNVSEKEAGLKKLKDNEAKLLSAQKIAKLGYWQLIPETQSLYWSNEIYNIWGVNKGIFELTRQKFLETIHPDDIDAFQKEIDDVFNRKKEHDFDHRIILPDGSIKWVHEKGKLITDKTGNVILFEGTVQDITESKIAQEKLLLSEARHRGIVDSQTNYIIRTDLQGRYSYGNNKFIEDFGWIYPGNDIIGKDSLVSVLEYHHPRVIATVEKCFASLNKVFQVEIDKPKENGEIITTLWDFICLTDSKGIPTEIQCVGIDISDRIKAEKALSESNKRYEYVTRATSDAIWDCNLETNVTFRGEGFKKLFGYDANEVDNGKISWTNYIHPNDRERVIRKLEIFIDGTETHWNDEYRYLKADGNYAFILDKGFVKRNEEGKAVKMVGAMKDVTERKMLQELLNKSNRLARIGSWEIDVPTGTVYWSDVTKEIREAANDFEPDLKMGMHYFKEGKDRETIHERVKKCKDDGTPWDEELQIVTQKGNLKWVRTIGEAEMVNGKCVKIYGSFQDIDEKKKAEIQILKLYEEKNTILESIGDGFFTVDNNWVVTYWNNQAEKLLLISKNKILGHNLWKIFIESVNSDAYKKYHEAIDTNTVVYFEDYYPSLGKWFEISAYPSNSGLSVYFHDITDRKKAEEAIYLTNERYRIVSLATNDSIWDWDLISNKVERPGRTMENLFGYPDVDPCDVNKFWQEHINTEDWENLVKNLSQRLAIPHENYWEKEYRFLKSDGTFAHVFDRAYIIRDYQNKAVRMIGASRDISKLKENEVQLKELNEQLQKRARQLAISNSELEQFAYIASHDLQEPLRMITSFLTLFEKKYSNTLDDKGKKYIHFAVDGAQRMRKIILDLLNYSRIGKFETRQEEVDLNELINEIIVLHRQQIKEKKAVIKFKQLPVITTSKAPMRQVFQNLISNSLKYHNAANGEFPHINISYKSTKTHWIFSLKDDGIGIDAENFEKIFIIFQRLHDNEEYSGSGMGLAITKKIVETMGGKIWVASDLAKGSTFYFTISKNNHLNELENANDEDSTKIIIDFTTDDKE